MSEEPEGGEKIEHCIEPSSPAHRHFSHVAASVAKTRTSAPLPCNCEELGGVIETIDVESRFSKQMRVPPLTARYVEDARTSRQSEQLDQARCLVTIPLGSKEKPVLQEIVGVER